jgi:hypothetical protein
MFLSIVDLSYLLLSKTCFVFLHLESRSWLCVASKKRCFAIGATSAGTTSSERLVRRGRAHPMKGLPLLFSTASSGVMCRRDPTAVPGVVGWVVAESTGVGDAGALSS